MVEFLVGCGPRVGGVLYQSYNKVEGIAPVKREMMGNGAPVENPPQTQNLVLLQVIAR